MFCHAQSLSQYSGFPDSFCLAPLFSLLIYFHCNFQLLSVFAVLLFVLTILSSPICWFTYSSPTEIFIPTSSLIFFHFIAFFFYPVLLVFFPLQTMFRQLRNQNGSYYHWGISQWQINNPFELWHLFWWDTKTLSRTARTCACYSGILGVYCHSSSMQVTKQD